MSAVLDVLILDNKIIPLRVSSCQLKFLSQVQLDIHSYIHRYVHTSCIYIHIYTHVHTEESINIYFTSSYKARLLKFNLLLIM